MKTSNVIDIDVANLTESVISEVSGTMLDRLANKIEDLTTWGSVYNIGKDAAKYGASKIKSVATSDGRFLRQGKNDLKQIDREIKELSKQIYRAKKKFGQSHQDYDIEVEDRIEKLDKLKEKREEIIQDLRNVDPNFGNEPVNEPEQNRPVSSMEKKMQTRQERVRQEIDALEKELFKVKDTISRYGDEEVPANLLYYRDRLADKISQKTGVMALHTPPSSNVNEATETFQVEKKIRDSIQRYDAIVEKINPILSDLFTLVQEKGKTLESLNLSPAGVYFYKMSLNVISALHDHIAREYKGVFKSLLRAFVGDDSEPINMVNLMIAYVKVVETFLHWFMMFQDVKDGDIAAFRGQYKKILTLRGQLDGDGHTTISEFVIDFSEIAAKFEKKYPLPEAKRNDEIHAFVRALETVGVKIKQRNILERRLNSIFDMLDDTFMRDIFALRFIINSAHEDTRNDSNDVQSSETPSKKSKSNDFTDERKLRVHNNVRNVLDRHKEYGSASKFIKAIVKSTKLDEGVNVVMRKNPRTGMNKIVLTCKSNEYKKRLNRTISIGGRTLHDVECLPKSAKPASQRAKDRKSAIKRWRTIRQNPSKIKLMAARRKETMKYTRKFSR